MPKPIPSPDNCSALYGQPASHTLGEKYTKDYYEETLGKLWWELVKLNSNSFIVRRIVDFPWEILGVNENNFWTLTLDALYESNVSILWKLCFDSNKDVLTLPKFRNSIRKQLESRQKEPHLCDCLSQFDKRLKEVGFEEKMKDLEPRLIELRHNGIAHFNKDYNTNPPQLKAIQSGLFLSDLERAGSIANDLFRALCFDHGRAMFFNDYNPGLVSPRGSDSRRDIEKLLDWLASESVVLKMPKEQPHHWPHYREKYLKKEDIEVLNKYRIKFGLSPIKETD